MRIRTILAIMAAAALLIGCAGTGERAGTERTGDLYARHAGGSAEHIRFSSVRNWMSAGYDGIVLEFDGRRHYLLNLAAPCDFELQHAVELRLVNTQPNLVTRFDHVEVGGEICRITSIRRIDMDAVRQELEDADLEAPEERNGIAVEQRDQDSGGT